MKKVLSILTLATMLLFAMSVIAADKVVVIPMGSSAKGTDGQIQYNDDGKTAGAEVYYDKATGKLEVPGEVRTVDGSGSNRQWGTGRPGTGLLTHTDPNGYCTTSTGIKHALSYMMGTWYDTAEVCPAGTWVCRSNDLPTDGSCPIDSVSTYIGIACDGTHTPISPAVQTTLPGFTADFPSNSEQLVQIRYSDDWGLVTVVHPCYALHVWCCWE